MEQEQINSKLKYKLLDEYFIDKDDYFKNLEKKVGINIAKNIKLFNNTIPYYSKNENINFIKEIKAKGIFGKFYEKSSKKINKKDVNDKEKIYILENGIYFYKFEKGKYNVFVYCIKDEKTEDLYLCDISNIEAISHSAYDKMEEKVNWERENIGDSDKPKSQKLKNINDISIINKEEKSLSGTSNKSENKISGIQNRAYTLESLVNYFFKSFNLVQLPDLIFNVSPPSERKFLYREMDGAYMNENKEEISCQDLKFILPFNAEKTYLIQKNEVKEDKVNKFSIFGKSLILFEIKMDFPKKKEKGTNKNLEEVIMGILEKVKFFIAIYKDIFKNLDIKNLQLLILFDQNKITKYKKAIQNHINKYKYLLDDYTEKLDVYFHILYIFPSIGKISLNKLNNQVITNVEEIEGLKNTIKEKDEKSKAKIDNLTKEIQKLNEKDEMSKAKIDNLTKEIEKLNRIINEKDSFKKNMDDLMNKIKKLEQDMKEKE